jgi:hypothetical protein
MILLLVCLLLLAPLHQQTRDSATQPTAGTASISGVVVDDQDPARPVRRAVITLTGSGLHPNRGAITDDEGRFALRNLPAGRFTLMAERGGFITSAYGARRPGRPGTEIAIVDGRQIADLRVRLWRGAVLSGVLRDESGEPLAHWSIAAIPARQVTPVALTLNNNHQAVTNDLGEFRIFGLEPGAYVLRSGSYAATQIAASEAEIDATFAALAARGRQAGGIPRPVERLEISTTIVSTAPIYYPGTPVVADATPITLEAGEQRSGLDFPVHRTRVASVRGVIVGPDGAPVAKAAVQLAADGRPAQFAGTTPEPAMANSGPDGTFTLSPISPGSYRLLVRGVIAPPSARSGGAPSAGWAVATVTVTGTDVDLARMALQPGLTLSGRVVVDDAATTTPPELIGLHVQIQPDSLPVASPQNRGRGGAANLRLLQPTAVRADGTFMATDLVPDNYRITMAGTALDGSGWWLRSAMWKGRDLLDGPLRLAPGEQMDGVTLMLSDRRTQLSGTITTSTGAAVSELFVIAYPADAALRVPQSRRIKAVRPDSGGKFLIENLPAGEYLICALTDIDDGQWNDPGFLDPLVPASVTITLADGDRKVQDLRVGG